MKNEKIIIPTKKLEYLRSGMSGMAKLSPKAYNMIVDIANESGRPMSKVASEIIEQAIEKGLVVLEQNIDAEDEDLGGD